MAQAWKRLLSVAVSFPLSKTFDAIKGNLIRITSLVKHGLMRAHGCVSVYVGKL